MIKGLIRNIRQKPKSARDGIAFGTAAVFSFLVFSVWAFNTPSRMAAIEESYAVNPDESQGIGSFFSGVREQFASAIQSIDISTSTPEVVVGADESESSELIMPSVEGVVEDLLREGATTSDTQDLDLSTEVKEPGEVETGREVRIVTTRPSSSASSTTP